MYFCLQYMMHSLVFFNGCNGFRQTDIWKMTVCCFSAELDWLLRGFCTSSRLLETFHWDVPLFSSSWSQRQKSGLCAGAVGSRRVAPGDQILVLSRFHGKSCWLEVSRIFWLWGKSEHPPRAHARMGRTCRFLSVAAETAGTPEPPGTGTI